MPRAGHKVKPAKAAPVSASTPSCTVGVPFTATKPTRKNTDWRASISKPSFLSRNFSESKLAGSVPDKSPSVPESSRRQDRAIDPPIRKPTVTVTVPVDSTPTHTNSECEEGDDTMEDSMSNELERFARRPTISRQSSSQSNGSEDTDEAALDAFGDLTVDETQSSASSTYSRDRSSIYSSDSASIYSSASSTYSSGASMYSCDDDAESRLPGGLQYQQRARNVPARRQETQDPTSRERSTLAKKAALFKNSRLPPQLPSFNTSLSTWSMVCRAGQASLDCYDSQSLTRRGTYTPADTSKDIKAMIIDDHLIDDSRLVIISIRGTQCQSLADWAVNKAANPVKPVGFLDDEKNECHAGFLQVSKAMVGQVAAQLQQHPASAEKPSLLFTGHSAGGAVAAMLYSHMLSTSVHSDLTALASKFPSINCVTFGAPPLSLTPLPRRDHASGVFLSFANQGDPILRLSNAAYVKSLAKLMTASPPSSATGPIAAPPVKVVRQSRGTRIIRQTLPTAPPTPWEELPLWPTPAAALTNSGEVILLRDKENGSAVASRVTSDDLKEVIFGDLTQHTIEVYIRRIREVAFTTIIGRNVN